MDGAVDNMNKSERKDLRRRLDLIYFQCKVMGAVESVKVVDANITNTSDDMDDMDDAIVPMQL